MKNRLITTLIAAAALIAAAPAADAQRHGRYHQDRYEGHSERHHHYDRHHGTHPRQARHANYVFISGHQACGTPIYTERYLIRYDRRFRPIFGYRTVGHRPHHVRPAPRGYHVPTCPPPRHRSGGRIHIRF